MLEVAVLGPVRARSRGHEHPLGGAKQQGLLACLVVSGGRPLSSGRLIDELWDDLAPRDPVHALQARISRLRAAVPVEIEWRDGGYRIDPGGIRTDSARFEQLCAQGRDAIGDGRLADAAAALRAALDLWKGQAFAGLRDITVLRAESARLEQLWAAALADRIDLDLALGRSAGAIAELQSLIEQDPFAERRWSQLMTALYCDGRLGEALEAFARARAVFAEHLGVEPSSELAQLHTRILREEAPESLLRIPADPRAPEPAAVETIRRLTSNQPDVLDAVFRDRRALLLTAPAGMGKTHLLRALRTRAEIRGRTVSLLTASPLSQPVPLGVFTGIVPENRMTPAGLVDHFTRHRSTAVLLVDDVEQLDEASQFVVSQLIRNSRVPTILTAADVAAAPEGLRALYDSGEVVEIVVDPLSVVDADDLVLHTIGGALTPESRQRLFGIAGGIPLHLRELLTASVAAERLVRTIHGWELRADPAPTNRLTQLIGERFEGLAAAELDAAARIAIAGEFPSSALEPTAQRRLARAGVVEYSAPGWLRLSHPLDREYLRSRCAPALWRDLAREVLHVLRGDEAATYPAARRHAHILALDLGERVDVDATIELAQYALGAFDARLALQAATAVIGLEPASTAAHRVAGVAASMRGETTDAAAHFETAARTARTPRERTAAALAHAEHVGLRRHDAAAALAIIEQALEMIDDPRETPHLRRDAMRWAVIAGQTAEIAKAPGDTSDAVAVRGLITAANAAATTGHVDDATLILQRLHRAPDEIVALVPSGATLIGLISLMALSNTGDITATRRRFEHAVADAEVNAPESIGTWEYGLALADLLCGDVRNAYEVAVSAVAHLEWRDTTGVLPAARALAGGAALAVGRAAEAKAHFAAVPAAAETDPKVVMLRAWAEAWRERSLGRGEAAARVLIDAARWILAAQHTYFAGLLVHASVRALGVAGDPAALGEAVALLHEAGAIGGGGLLGFFVRHADATASADLLALDAIAREAETLGMASTAADIRAMLTGSDADPPDVEPSMALWWSASTTAQATATRRPQA